MRVSDKKACIANIRGPHICGEAIDVKVRTNVDLI